MIRIKLAAIRIELASSSVAHPFRFLLNPASFYFHVLPILYFTIFVSAFAFALFRSGLLLVLPAFGPCRARAQTARRALVQWTRAYAGLPTFSVTGAPNLTLA